MAGAFEPSAFEPSAFEVGWGDRATIGLFDAAEQARLGAHEIVPVPVVELHHEDGIGRYWPGYGTLRIAGQDYLGVSDPEGVRVVRMSAIEAPAPAAAGTVDILLSPVDAAFFRTLKTDPGTLDGRRADIGLALFDAGENAAPARIVWLWVDGVCNPPKLRTAPAGRRQIMLSVEGPEATKNFPTGGTLTHASQDRRSPGDTACRHIGDAREERWPSVEAPS